MPPRSTGELTAAEQAIVAQFAAGLEASDAQEQIFQDSRPPVVHHPFSATQAIRLAKAGLSTRRADWAEQLEGERQFFGNFPAGEVFDDQKEE